MRGDKLQIQAGGLAHMVEREQRDMHIGRQPCFPVSREFTVSKRTEHMAEV